MAKIQKGKVTFENEGSEPIYGYVKGTCKWAKILEPDDYKKFSINLYGEDVENMEEMLTELRDSGAEEIEALGKKFNLMDVIKVDDDGKKFLSFKLPSKNFEGEDNSIKIYDASGKLVEGWDKLIGNGSVVKVKYRAAPYFMAGTKLTNNVGVVGVSLKFYALQVIKLVEYDSDSGFGDETDSGAPFDSESEEADY